jgi:hypothetical protein
VTGFARLLRRRGGGVGDGRLQAGALFDQRQLHFLDRHDLVGHGVEAFEQLDRAFGIGAADDEFLAAPEDGDVEGGRDLAQVFVERTAEVGEPRVIERLGDEVRRLGRFGFQLGFGNRINAGDQVAAQGVIQAFGDAHVDQLADQRSRRRPGRS